ncbi:type IV pilus modification protein PilV [Endozoicomonas sp. SCSIO W0465]|uniref:type IV pilus modification protein PilV n=1 Tax=Endozoicomonas sp. SCSIO W0465 TaxID=2918516 RepID=UPI002074B2D1|nr:type IV pilus modification protein PilV [Endozoicomonas sp. SCSIO W0465]USE37534.1 type IV pilus modification protein PilV [Endozoicomonas sp. SCSIO W0465]
MFITDHTKPINAQPGSLSLAALFNSGRRIGLIRQKGIGLIEVMIGVLIFVGGVMAIAGMQTKAIQTNHDAIQRSQAVWMANAAAELMKLNPAGLASSAYQTAASRASANLNAYCPAAPPQCIGSTCSSDQMAEFDIHDLMCSSVNTIIEPRIEIECNASCGPTDKVRIQISWGSRRAEQGALADRQLVEFRYNRN